MRCAYCALRQPVKKKAGRHKCARRVKNRDVFHQSIAGEASPDSALRNPGYGFTDLPGKHPAQCAALIGALLAGQAQPAPDFSALHPGYVLTDLPGKHPAQCAALIGALRVSGAVL